MVNHEKAELIIIAVLVGYIYLSGGLSGFGINPPEGFDINSLIPKQTESTANPSPSPSGPYCGDSWCDLDENMVNCPGDCGAPSGPRKYGTEFQGTCDAGQVCTGSVSIDYLACKDLEGSCQQVKSGTPCYDSTHRLIGECCWC